MRATPAPATVKIPTQKSIITTITLQCIPLVAAAGCAAQGVTNQNFGIGILFWVTILFWGFGYRYIGRMGRFVAALLIGPLFAMTSCVASLKGVSYDYEHSYKYTNSNSPDPSYQTDVNSANRASYQEALTIAGAVLLLSVDAWRLAALHNERLARGALPPPSPSTKPSAADELNERPEDSSTGES
jgi:hypothetical protein